MQNVLSPGSSNQYGIWNNVNHETQNLLGIALKLVWAHNRENHWKSFEVPFKYSAGIFRCIKAIQWALVLFIMKKMNEQRVQSDTGKLNTDDEVLQTEDCVSRSGFLPSESRTTYGLGQRRIYLIMKNSRSLTSDTRMTTWKTIQTMTAFLTITCLRFHRKMRTTNWN